MENVSPLMPTNTSSTTQATVIMLLSANTKRAADLFKGGSLKASYIDKGIILTHAPRSHMQSENITPPIVQLTIHGPGSLHFSGIPPIKADMELPKGIVSNSLILSLCIHKSFRNFAYLGTC